MRALRPNEYGPSLIIIGFFLLAMLIFDQAQAQPGNGNGQGHTHDDPDSVEVPVQDEAFLEEEVAADLQSFQEDYPVDSVGGIYAAECSSATVLQTNKIGIGRARTEIYCVKLQMADAYLAAAVVCFDYTQDLERCEGFITRSMDLVDEAGVKVDQRDKWFAGWRDTLLLR